jgi:exosortase K
MAAPRKSRGRARWRAATIAAVAVGLWALKRHYAEASLAGLVFILGPTATLVSLLSGAPFELESGAGYLNREHLFVIGKPCAGINFMVVAWGMLALVFSRRSRDMTTAAGAVVASLSLSYVAAVIVNATRLLLAVTLAAHPLVSTFWTAARIHRALGIAVYFGGLTLLHACALRLVAADRTIPRGIADTLRGATLPLLSYYAIALGVPLLRRAGSVRLLEHAAFVLPLPLALLCANGIVRGAWRYRRAPATYDAGPFSRELETGARGGPRFSCGR